jgi:hypothetical protein
MAIPSSDLVQKQSDTLNDLKSSCCSTHAMICCLSQSIFSECHASVFTSHPFVLLSRTRALSIFGNRQKILCDGWNNFFRKQTRKEEALFDSPPGPMSTTKLRHIPLVTTARDLACRRTGRSRPHRPQVVDEAAASYQYLMHVVVASYEYTRRQISIQAAATHVWHCLICLHHCLFSGGLGRTGAGDA